MWHDSPLAWIRDNFSSMKHAAECFCNCSRITVCAGPYIPVPHANLKIRKVPRPDSDCALRFSRNLTEGHVLKSESRVQTISQLVARLPRPLTYCRHRTSAFVSMDSPRAVATCWSKVWRLPQSTEGGLQGT